MVSVLARSASAEVVGYAEPAGHPRMRKTACAQIKRLGMHVNAGGFYSHQRPILLDAPCQPKKRSDWWLF
jgi:hypothetical protein